jgi:hypothetical protein
MGPTHTWNNVNYADAFNLSMMGIGLGLLLFGLALLASKKATRRVLETSLSTSGD